MDLAQPCIILTQLHFIPHKKPHITYDFLMQTMKMLIFYSAYFYVFSIKRYRLLIDCAYVFVCIVSIMQYSLQHYARIHSFIIFICVLYFTAYYNIRIIYVILQRKRTNKRSDVSPASLFLYFFYYFTRKLFFYILSSSILV